ncbi:MAG: NADH:ubiquinone oxidoreductase subunit 5 (chain L)/multisubunit Na+/H+ antiporter, MnhA subunit [Planctomycetaceae bacterium]|nr:NADH:ubiquinone oxidoreductase subunit 5 (chain L)/multisubunit Na+/H+ antiporter, MnhA subunit [Planctomycetaceae bacterium]
MTFDNAQIMYCLGLIVVASPVLLFCLLGLTSLVDRPLTEQATSRVVQITINMGLLAAVIQLAMMLPLAQPHVPISLGNWVDIGQHEKAPRKSHAARTEAVHHETHDGATASEVTVDETSESHTELPHYHFLIKFIFDRLSVPFVILTFILCATIGAFATRYMHREPGFNRFFVLFAMFMLGMIITSLAGSIETLFAGWELVGLSSALLVAFFQERSAPVRNGLRVWSVYRFSDAALLIAALTLHHMTGEGDFEKLMGKDNLSWPMQVTDISTYQAFVVGMFLLLAAAGKSALVPFSGWLPRAMEGPTPSSAIFYGALSVHLGAFLLLRFSPLLDQSIALRIAVTALGLVTAVFAFLSGRAQTDIKSALCFASLTQVGIIVAEIGVFSGPYRYIPLIHILGHGCLRTLQFVRAPTILQDYRVLENAIGNRLPRLPGFWERLIPENVRSWLYRFALERGYLDSYLNDFVVGPVLRLFRHCDGLERRWTNFLTGATSRDSKRIDSSAATLEDL